MALDLDFDRDRQDIEFFRTATAAKIGVSGAAHPPAVPSEKKPAAAAGLVLGFIDVAATIYGTVIGLTAADHNALVKAAVTAMHAKGKALQAERQKGPEDAAATPRRDAPAVDAEPGPAGPV
jgi:hypothetical protein